MGQMKERTIDAKAEGRKHRELGGLGYRRDVAARAAQWHTERARECDRAADTETASIHREQARQEQAIVDAADAGRLRPHSESYPGKVKYAGGTVQHDNPALVPEPAESTENQQ